MRTRKIALVALAVVLLIPAFLLTSKDVFVDGLNCGAALFPRDAAQFTQSTGDVANDDFQRQAIAEECSRAHTRQWFFAGLCLVASAALLIVAWRLKPKEPRFPGDPVI
jgi:hypothetical protein